MLAQEHLDFIFKMKIITQAVFLKYRLGYFVYGSNILFELPILLSSSIFFFRIQSL